MLMLEVEIVLVMMMLRRRMIVMRYVLVGAVTIQKTR